MLGRQMGVGFENFLQNKHQNPPYVWILFGSHFFTFLPTGMVASYSTAIYACQGGVHTTRPRPPTFKARIRDSTTGEAVDVKRKRVPTVLNNEKGACDHLISRRERVPSRLNDEEVMSRANIPDDTHHVFGKVVLGETVPMPTAHFGAGTLFSRRGVSWKWTIEP